MIVRGRATAYHTIKEPKQLKLIYDAAQRVKYKKDIRDLATCWAQALKDGEKGRYRVMLEVSYKAGLFAYDWGRRYKVCAISINYVPDILIKLHKGDER